MDGEVKKPDFIEVRKQGRTYIFPPPDSDKAPSLTYNNIVKMKASKSGNHRLEDEDGNKYIVFTERKNAYDCLAIHLDLDEWTF